MNLFIGPREDNNMSIKESEMMIAEDIASRQMIKEDQAALARARNIKLNTKFRAGVNLAEDRTAAVVGQGFEAAGTGMRQGRPTFSREQQMLGEMFGQGEKIWGTNNQPVIINNDLNPSRSDPWDETGSMFGFGGHSERSGLF